MVIFLVSVSGTNSGIVIWAQNSASILGYKEDEDLTLEMLVPTCFRRQHEAMMRRLKYQRTMPRIFDDVYNMHIVCHNQLLLYGKWRIYLTNLKDSRELAILATFQITKDEKEFCVLSEEGKMQERTAGFQTFLNNSSFLATANLTSKAEFVWEGIFQKQIARVMRSQWDLMNSTASILTLHISELETGYDPMTFLMRSDQEARQGVRFGNLRSSKGNRDEKQTLGYATEATTESFHSPSKLFDDKVSEMKRRQGRSAQVLTVGMGLVGVLGVVVSIVLLMVIRGENESFNATIGEMNNMGLRRFLAVTAALRSKELFLISQGFQAFGNETKSRSDLMLVGEQLKSMSKAILSGAESFTDDFESVLYSQSQPYWEYQEDDFELRFLSTLDVMSELASNAIVLSTLPLTSLSFSTPQFRNLYRNGLTTAFPTFNSTLTAYISSVTQSRDSHIASLQAAVLVCVCVLLVCGVACAVPVLVKTETSRRALWKVLFALPRKALQTTFDSISTHLKDHHDIEDQGPLESESAGSKRQPRYSMSISKKLLLVCISLHVSLSSGLQYAIYLQGVSNSDLLLSRKPWAMNWAGLLRAESQSLLFYMRESWLQRYQPDIVMNPDYSSDLEWMGRAEALKRWEWTLAYDPAYTFLLSAEHKELILGGTGPLVSEVCGEALRLLGEGQGRDYEQESRAEKVISRLLPLLNDSVAMYHADSEALLEASEAAALYLTVGYVVGSILYLAVLLPVFILKVRNRQAYKEQRREIELLLFLPKEFMLKYVLKL
jgi:hypothetical protein